MLYPQAITVYGDPPGLKGGVTGPKVAIHPPGTPIRISSIAEAIKPPPVPPPPAILVNEAQANGVPPT